jgi:hypothetical protein
MLFLVCHTNSAPALSGALNGIIQGTTHKGSNVPAEAYTQTRAP